MMMHSQIKMMRVKPKADAIQARYKHLKATDPRARRNEPGDDGALQAGRHQHVRLCLPMLVQMPLFFAYFRVLQNAVELRQAHWFWLTDLSQPDPTHVLPILIILTMFLTQYITPSPQMDQVAAANDGVHDAHLLRLHPVALSLRDWHSTGAPAT